MMMRVASTIAETLPKPVRLALKTRVFPHLRRTQRALTGKTPLPSTAQRLRVPGAETFIGYYEVQPVSGDGQAVLAHAAKAARCALTGGETAQLGWFDLASGAFTKVAETQLWCWQMGARLRWWSAEGERALLFNGMSDGAAAACVADGAGAVRRLCGAALFDVAEERGIGLSLNFARLARCRPGYGYPLLADRFADDALPDGDGVTLVDLASGRSELAYAMPQFAACVEGAGSADYHYLNAAAISPLGSRFSVLYLRHDGRWLVEAMVGNSDGSGLALVDLPGVPSHYWWLDEDRVVFTVVAGRACQYLVHHCASGTLTPLSPAAPAVDGHPSLSPDGASWITDHYPDRYGEQALYRFAQGDGAAREIARFAADPRYQGEWRCDLHPRWAGDGGSVLVDSTHEGFRAIYRVPA